MSLTWTRSWPQCRTRRWPTRWSMTAYFLRRWFFSSRNRSADLTTTLTTATRPGPFGGAAGSPGPKSWSPTGLDDRIRTRVVARCTRMRGHSEGRRHHCWAVGQVHHRPLMPLSGRSEAGIIDPVVEELLSRRLVAVERLSW